VLGQIYYRLYTPRPRIGQAPTQRPVDANAWVRPCTRPQSLFPERRVSFLQREGAVNRPEDWNDSAQPLLWLFNLHYFDDCNSWGTPDRTDLQRQWMGRWIEENPPARGVGWSPYPLSLRIVNWIKWALAGNPLEPRMIDSLAVQTRHLDRLFEWHIQANHLIANIKALLFAGLFFQGREAEGWADKGLRLLERERAEQILPDGGHYERTPMYHGIILEDLLDLLNLVTAFRRVDLCTWRPEIDRMRRWLLAMCHPDNQICLFNDATFGIAPDPSRLEAYAEDLGLPAQSPPTAETIHLQESGYVRLAMGPVVVFAGIAPIEPTYQPGHAHADTLSFELSLKGRRALVNSGVSRYGLGAERLRQRGTAAHNALTVDDLDSTEVWHAFRVARRARVLGVSVDDAEGPVVVEASHDGYCRLGSVGLHRRRWRLDRESLIIEDELEGAGIHGYALHYHFHPEMIPVATGNRVIESTDRGDPSSRMRVQLDQSLAVVLEDTTFHPGFGVSIPTQKIVARGRSALPVRLQTHISW